MYIHDKIRAGKRKETKKKNAFDDIVVEERRALALALALAVAVVLAVARLTHLPVRRREGSDGHLQPPRRERRRLGGELLVLKRRAEHVEGVHLRHVHTLALAPRHTPKPDALAVVSLVVVYPVHTHVHVAHLVSRHRADVGDVSLVVERTTRHACVYK